MGVGQQAFAVDNDGHFAGINSPSALPYRGGRYVVIGKGIRDLEPRKTMTHVTSSTTPVTTFDWISPTLGDSVNLSPSRAERTADILNRLACPSAERTLDFLYGSAADRGFFNVQLRKEAFTQMSFATNYHFNAVARGVSVILPEARRNGGSVVIGPPNRRSERAELFTDTSSSVDLPSDYRPRFDRVRRPSGKVLITDGCRFLTNDGLLDIDINPDPNYFSFFTVKAPIESDNNNSSTAFRRTGNDRKSANSWQLSVRHNGNTQINTTRFDGSVQTISIETLWADPTPWFPTGSRWRGGATPEANEFMQNEQFIN